MLLGNHELMSLTGNRDYAKKSDYAAFAQDETERERNDLRQRYIKDHENKKEKDFSEEFDRLFPPGFIALDRAFSLNGYIGKWLLAQPVILKINDTVFVHGGIPSGFVKKSLSEINEEGRTHLNRYLKTVDRLSSANILPKYVGFYDRLPYLNSKAKKLIDADPEVNTNPQKRPAWFNDVLELNESQQSWIFTGEGPLWYRGTSVCNVNCESFNTERFLKNVKAARVVVGHTPTSGHQVINRMDGMVLRLDTGMLNSYYRGQASALIIEKDHLYVHYPGNPEKTPPEKESFSLSRKLSGMNDSELEDFLLTGEIINKKDLGTGITRPMKITLKKGEKTINAVFKTYDSSPGFENTGTSFRNRGSDETDRYVYDVAAYRLDRMLDLQMVPTAVLRKIDGKEGVLQYWVENSINERDREKDNISFDSFCSKKEQYWLRYLFDILIYNEDRNLTNILWTKNDFMMVFIDHSRAFRNSGSRPKMYRKVPLYISDFLRKKLENLNTDNLNEALSPYLNRFQINAIIKRRDRIMKEGKYTG